MTGTEHSPECDLRVCLEGDDGELRHNRRLLHLMGIHAGI